MPLRVTPKQVSAFRLERSHLTRRKPATLLEVAGDLCGVQAQMMGSAHLALNARLPHLTREEIREALYDKRTLVKAHLVRQTLHLLPSEQYPTYIAAIKQSRVAAVHRIMARLGITPQHSDELVRIVLDELSAGPLTDTALRARVRPRVDKNLREWIDKVSFVARPAVVEGLVCYGPNAGNEIMLVRTDRWLPKQKPVTREAAQRFLVRAYLRTYGPASARDFAFWSGIGMKEVALICKEMEPEFAEVELYDRKLCVLHEDKAALAESKSSKPQLRLLPSFDVFLLAHAGKSHLVDNTNYKAVYRNQGWISPVILVDGQIVGTWSHERTNKLVSLELKPFEKLPRSLEPQIESEAERISRFFNLPCQVSRLRV